MLLRECWRQDLKLFRASLFPCLSCHWESSLQVFDQLLRRHLGLKRGDSWGNRLPDHLDRLLFRAPGPWRSHLDSTTEHGPSVDLRELRLVPTRMRIDVESLHVLPITESTIRWICVCISVRVESWLTKVRGERRVWQPSRAKLHVLELIFKLLPLVRIKLFHLLVQDSLSLGTYGLLIRA